MQVHKVSCFSVVFISGATQNKSISVLSPHNNQHFHGNGISSPIVPLSISTLTMYSAKCKYKLNRNLSFSRLVAGKFSDKQLAAVSYISSNRLMIDCNFFFFFSQNKKTTVSVARELAMNYARKDSRGLVFVMQRNLVFA